MIAFLHRSTAYDLDATAVRIELHREEFAKLTIVSAAHACVRLDAGEATSCLDPTTAPGPSDAVRDAASIHFAETFRKD